MHWVLGANFKQETKMKFDIPVNFTIEADSEKEAEERLTSLLKSVMITDGQELGINKWEFMKFISNDIY